MMRLLFLLLPLLTDRTAMMAMLHSGLTFATANTGILCFLGAFEAIRRRKRNPSAQP
jgi:hypothetical protein